MKNKLLKLSILIFSICYLFVLFPHIAKADDSILVNQIQITQKPTKLAYSKGESLDLSGMVVTGYGNDGTSNVITNYNVSGFDTNKIGLQTITISYQNATAIFNVTVNPAKVMNVKALVHSTSELTIGWDSDPDVTSYQVYSIDDTTGTYSLAATTISNCVSFQYAPGTVHKYQICAIKEIDGTKYNGAFSDEFIGATNPEQVTNLAVMRTTQNSVELSWNSALGAGGYRIYYYDSNTSKYIFCMETTNTTAQVIGLNSGTAYKFKVNAYVYNKAYLGKGSSAVKTSTNPAAAILHCKAGDQKIRLTWTKVTGASSYDIYMGDEINGYTLLGTNEGGTNCTYIATGLTIGSTYTFYEVTHRKYNGTLYDSIQSYKQEVTVKAIQDTSTDAKYFKSLTDLKKSAAFTNITYFKKNVDFSKSVAIPGLITTNVGGFVSTKMCPQGITFAENYMLLSAYDMAAEENSVIYVMDKTTGKLIKTLILPYKYHVGGICYDGANIWITTGTKVTSVPFSEIQKALETQGSYADITIGTSTKIGFTASYITYYKDKLWVGSYDELKSTYMYGYKINSTADQEVLTKSDTVVMPTRVQGVSFTEDGYLILSRSCQLFKGLRGYTHRIDVYKPDFKENSYTKQTLGKLINYVYTPSMNEGIALCDSYIYVNFESGAFENASYKMDHICAFKLSSIINIAKPEII